MEAHVNTARTCTELVTISGGLSGIDPVPVPYREGTWQPNYALLRWTRHREGEDAWGPWQLSGSITGPHLKLDGSEGRRKHTARVYNAQHELPKDVWAWVLSTEPAGDPG